jgi:hypothetical protein
MHQCKTHVPIDLNNKWSTGLVWPAAAGEPLLSDDTSLKPFPNEGRLSLSSTSRLYRLKIEVALIKLNILRATTITQVI